jgi:methionyl-tRNA synthetase
MMKVVEKMLEWENAGKTRLLSVGYSLRAPELLFRKIEDAEIAAQIEKLKSGLVKPVTAETSSAAAGNNSAGRGAGTLSENAKQNVLSDMNTTTAQPVDETQSGKQALKPEIVYDDFGKLDLRVGRIVSAEKVQKADKLLKLEVDLGFEVRTIVSGIAAHFKPEDITGRQVTVVANLAPRKMRGIESNGMILMAEDKSGKLHFVNPDNDVDAGSPVT